MTKRQWGIPKNAAIVVLTEPRPCDQCKAQGCPCLLRFKGGQPLEACQGCYTRKISCQTVGKGGRKKVTMEVRDMKNMEDSSESKGEGDESGREWLNKFSTMKVGLPKHTKPMTELKGLSSEAKVITCRVTSRLAGVEVKRRLKKRRLKKLHGHLPNTSHYQAN